MQCDFKWLKTRLFRWQNLTFTISPLVRLKSGLFGDSEVADLPHDFPLHIREGKPSHGAALWSMTASRMHKTTPSVYSSFIDGKHIIKRGEPGLALLPHRSVTNKCLLMFQIEEIVAFRALSQRKRFDLVLAITRRLKQWLIKYPAMSQQRQHLRTQQMPCLRVINSSWLVTIWFKRCGCLYYSQYMTFERDKTCMSPPTRYNWINACYKFTQDRCNSISVHVRSHGESSQSVAGESRLLRAPGSSYRQSYHFSSKECRDGERRRSSTKVTLQSRRRV